MYKYLCLILALVFFLNKEIEICSLVEATPLDDYVNKPDSNYKWFLVKAYSMTGYSVYVLNVTSQKWLDRDDFKLYLHFCLFKL